jgi:hypothetical protein
MGLREWVQAEPDRFGEGLAKAAARGVLEFLTSMSYTLVMALPGSVVGVFAEGQSISISVFGINTVFTAIAWWQFASFIWLIAAVVDFHRHERTDMDWD